MDITTLFVMCEIISKHGMYTNEAKNVNRKLEKVALWSEKKPINSFIIINCRLFIILTIPFDYISIHVDGFYYARDSDAVRLKI